MTPGDTQYRTILYLCVIPRVFFKVEAYGDTEVKKNLYFHAVIVIFSCNPSSMDLFSSAERRLHTGVFTSSCENKQQSPDRHKDNKLSKSIEALILDRMQKPLESSSNICLSETSWIKG